jgi:hypothetical protein
MTFANIPDHFPKLDTLLTQAVPNQEDCGSRLSEQSSSPWSSLSDSKECKIHGPLGNRLPFNPSWSCVPSESPQSGCPGADSFGFLSGELERQSGLGPLLSFCLSEDD